MRLQLQYYIRFCPCRALYQVSADEYLNNLSVVFGSMVSLDEVGALYRVHEIIITKLDV